MRSLTLLAGVAALAFAGAARADDDLIRLDGMGEDAEVQDARFVAGGSRGFVAGGGRGFVAGGSRGFVAGGSRGFVAGGSRGFVAGGRGYWGGGWGWRGGWAGGGWGWRGGWGPAWGVRGWAVRPGWGVAVARPWYGGSFGGGFPVYTDSGSYCGCSANLASPVPTYNLTEPAQNAPMPGAPMAPSDGTFPYDGSPNNGVFPAPMRGPNVAPRDSRMVSLTSPQYQFLAFGETAPAALERTAAATVPVSLTFPAFGEDSMPTGGFSGGTTVYASLMR